MNTENVKIRIFDEENKTTLTIKQTTKEDDATYVCKATNEIGMIVTKAKLHIDTISESRRTTDDIIEEEEKLDIKLKKQEEKPYKKKKIDLKKAKEMKEKVKAERIKIEKEEIREEKLIPKEQIEEKSVMCYFINYFILNIFHISDIFESLICFTYKFNLYNLTYNIVLIL